MLKSNRLKTIEDFEESTGITIDKTIEISIQSGMLTLSEGLELLTIQDKVTQYDKLEEILYNK